MLQILSVAGVMARLACPESAEGHEIRTYFIQKE